MNRSNVAVEDRPRLSMRVAIRRTAITIKREEVLIWVRPSSIVPSRPLWDSPGRRSDDPGEMQQQTSIWRLTYIFFGLQDNTNLFLDIFFPILLSASISEHLAGWCADQCSLFMFKHYDTGWREHVFCCWLVGCLNAAFMKLAAILRCWHCVSQCDTKNDLTISDLNSALSNNSNRRHPQIT